VQYGRLGLWRDDVTDCDASDALTEDLDTSEAAVSGLRDEAIKKVGGKTGKVELFEVYFTEILMPVAATH